MTAHALHAPDSAQATSTEATSTEATSTQVTNTQATSDTAALDAIATILGTTAEWDSDTMSRVSGVVSRVRPGFEHSPNHFAAAFTATTGRPLPAAYDARSDQECHPAIRATQALPLSQLRHIAADAIAAHSPTAGIPDLAGPAAHNLSLSLRAGRRRPTVTPATWQAALAHIEANTEANGQAGKDSDPQAPQGPADLA